MQRKKTFDSFRRCKVVILSVLMSFCMTAAFAQSGAVKGKVLDELGEPIIGANIVEKGTTNGTITDMDGNYSLTVNDLKKAVLQASFIGYNTIEESVKGRSTVEIKLSPSVVNLGEVVAIGYGTQTRREITGSVANVSEESFNKGITRDASDLLQGKVAGLTITSGSGDVTRGSTMRLRGTSTLQNDQGPLIVIDGIPGGDMSTVAPFDIESISVLKDASSAAIYGAQAANGVILITTKKGKTGKASISLKADWGFSDFAMDYRPTLSGAERREYIYNGMVLGQQRSGKSDADAIAYADKNIDKYAPVPWCGYTDWGDYLFKKGSHSSYSNTILHCPISTKKVL